LTVKKNHAQELKNKAKENRNEGDDDKGKQSAKSALAYSFWLMDLKTKRHLVQA
jgi:F0F1-type ATP synthase epsilon subunit